MGLRVVTLSLHPTPEQAAALEATMRAFNAACQYISDVAWAHHEFRRVRVHRLTYRDVRERFGLSSQLAVRAIGVVTDSYKADREVKHTFRPDAAVVYDERVMKLGATTVSLRTVTGRESIRWAGGGYQRNRLAAAITIGQADLLYRADKKRWRLAVAITLPDVPHRDVADAIGVDQGIVNVATTSDGDMYGGSTVLGLRRRFYHLRRKLQTKGTKSARRLLTKRSKRERRFMADVNHRLTKQIAQAAQSASRAVGVENLQGIRARVQVRQEQRRTHSSWAFGQFTAFLAYKCADRGVPFVLLDPRDTSKTCSRCGHCEKANRHSQSSFLCRRCGFAAHADWNGAENIRQRAVALFGAGAVQPPTRLEQLTLLLADKLAPLARQSLTSAHSSS
jgi:IS605 OrfB family transposase